MRVARRPLSLFALAATLAACGTDRIGAPPPDAASGAPTSSLDVAFARAGTEFRVPSDLLKAISFAETRWQMVRGGEELPGLAPAYGVMALRGDRLAQGARLAGITVDDARADPLANVRAAAALLDTWATEASIDRGNLDAWAPLVARYGNLASRDAEASYVHRDVYAALRDGATGDGVTLRGGREVAPRFPAPPARVAGSADYAPAIWRPSPNYNARPAGEIGKPAMVIVHTCEGSYASCWSWLASAQSGVSAHYVVNESGSEISQLVLEANRAWHIGATYDCALNASVDCWRNGYSSNHFTVGIEHGGFASQASFPVGQVDASAKLSCDISKSQGIPRDRQHFVAHGQLQPATRTDPGPNWPWTDYMNRINSYCGSATIIVDSNNGNNNTAQGYIEVSASWTSTAATPGYYGSGYYFANTAAVSDPATFWFYLPAAATKSVDAWWVAGANRSTTTPFVAWNAAGTKLGTVSVNQRVNGGKWNALGAWNFTAGWNKVQVSRWTTAGAVVVADAVRIR